MAARGFLSRRLGQVLEQKETAFAGYREIQVAIAIEVGDWNLHTASSHRTKIDDVPGPENAFSLGARVRLLPITTEGFAGARIVIVGQESLAADQVFAAVAV